MAYSAQTTSIESNVPGLTVVNPPQDAPGKSRLFGVTGGRDFDQAAFNCQVTDADANGNPNCGTTAPSGAPAYDALMGAVVNDKNDNGKCVCFYGETRGAAPVTYVAASPRIRGIDTTAPDVTV